MYCVLGESDRVSFVHVDERQPIQFFIQRGTGTIGPLGQSFLRQGRCRLPNKSSTQSINLVLGDTGMMVYVVMTVLNGLTIGTFFR